MANSQGKKFPKADDKRSKKKNPKEEEEPIYKARAGSLRAKASMKMGSDRAFFLASGATSSLDKGQHYPVLPDIRSTKEKCESAPPPDTSSFLLRQESPSSIRHRLKRSFRVPAFLRDDQSLAPPETAKSSTNPFSATLVLSRFIRQSRDRKTSANQEVAFEFSNDPDQGASSPDIESKQVPFPGGKRLAEQYNRGLSVSSLHLRPILSKDLPTSGPGTVASGLMMREAILMKRKSDWTDLRSRLVHAKVTDAFTNARYEVRGKKYTVLRQLGQGGYARVFEVFSPENELFALKVVDLVDTKLQHELLNEIQLLKKFQGSNKVIKMIEHEHVVNEDKNNLYILLERGETDLESIIHRLQNDERLTYSKLRYFWEEMLEALKVLHDAHVVHADIKPSNFLLVNGHIKIIDLGLASELPGGKDSFVTRSYIGGTKDFLSPETLSAYSINEGQLQLGDENGTIEASVGLKSDVWAMGIILYQWTHGTVPFSGIPGGRTAKISAIVNPDQPIEFDLRQEQALLDVLRMCLERSPEKRASVDQLLAHAFLQK